MRFVTSVSNVQQIACRTMLGNLGSLDPHPGRFCAPPKNRQHGNAPIAGQRIQPPGNWVMLPPLAVTQVLLKPFLRVLGFPNVPNRSRARVDQAIDEYFDFGFRHVCYLPLLVAAGWRRLGVD
jgi:hypothetical protein